MLGKNNSISILSFLEIITVVIICLFFVYLCLNDPKSVVSLGFVIFCIPLAFFSIKKTDNWLVSRDVTDEKKMLTYFMFIYPLLPCLWGINIGGGIPVFRAQRIAALILIFYLYRRGLFRQVYTDFIKANIFTYPIVFIIISFLITSFFSTNMKGTFFYLFYFVFEILILPVVVFTVFKTRKDIELLINIICLSAFILSIIGIYERITEYNFYSVFGAYDVSHAHALEHARRFGSIRIKGPFMHSISFSSYLATTLPLFLYKYYNNSTKLIISSGLVMFALISTQSRGGIIGAILILGIYFTLYDRKNIFYILLLSIPLIVLNYDSIAVFFNQLNPTGSSDQELANSSKARSIQFEILSEYIKQNIIIGYGKVPTPAIMRIPGRYSRSVDNFYLLLTYSFGFFGLLSYVYLMINIIIKPIKILGKKIYKDKLITLLLTGVFAFYIINTVVSLEEFHFIFWIYVGILARLLVNRLKGQNAWC
ncbi:MAG: O-antigen ligase family protein [Spirochaetota bacterium]|nr:O-antigen ligase family protein [Spirochaetota bacterium]